MTDTLLIIMIALLVVLVVLIIVLLTKKPMSQNYDKRELENLFNDSRVKSLKDVQEGVRTQNLEISNLKEAITKGMIEAQSDNNLKLHNFLEETQKKLVEIQTNFSKESSDVKEKNFKNIQELIDQTKKDLNELKTKILSEINETNVRNNQNINEQNVKTQEQITSQITKLREQVQKSLEQGFEKNEKAMHDFIEKTASIEASAKQMEDLKKEINKFNNILSNQKARGNFGEDVLEQILVSMFGDLASNHFYKKQVDLTKELNLRQTKDSLIVDFMFNVATNHGTIPLSIDAKFPYVNYLPLLDEEISLEERDEAKKKFKRDVNDRIKEVTKYIVDGKTAPYAIMFIPSEAIFIDIFKEFKDVVENARKSRIIIASPSLIVTIIQILQFILQDYQIRNNADQILHLIDDIGKEFRIFSNKWQTHKNRLGRILEDFRDIDINATNLEKQFDETKTLIGEKTLESNEEKE